MTGGEGLLTLTIRMRVSPEPDMVNLLKRYKNALNRDVITVLNIEKKALIKMGGALIPSTALQITDVNPNRCGEPMNSPRGTFVLQGEEEVS